jgi:alpha-tubulin suppressor-like RCC1 family protein
VALGRVNDANPGQSYSVTDIKRPDGRDQVQLLEGSQQEARSDAALLRLGGFDADHTAAIPLAFESSVVYHTGGVTLYGYGDTRWTSSVEAEGVGTLHKSPDGAYVQQPACFHPYVRPVVCFHRTRSTYVMTGDSGSGWLRWTSGAWQLIGLAKGIYDPSFGRGKRNDPVFGPSSLAVLDWIRRTARLPLEPASTIVRNRATGTSWLIGRDRYRHWIPNGRDFHCFIARGSRVVSLPRASVESIPERMGSPARCTPPRTQISAWGRNDKGQLGNGTTSDSSRPVHVLGSSGITTAISAGSHHSLALRSNGTVWAWGYNVNGQLGDGTTTDSSRPVQVRRLSNVIAVAAGDYCSVALRSDGTVWAWGFNANGQLGDDTITSSSTPIRIRGLSNITAIAAEEGGAFHILALRSDGTVWAWGSNAAGQLGDGTRTNSSTPVRVQGLTEVTAIGVGFFFSMALRSDGTVWSWGFNQHGELGDGTTTTRLTPVPVIGLAGVTAIAAGGSHKLALRSDGTVWAWGSNYLGQLGNGTTTDSSTPVQVIGLSGMTAITAGGSHSLALRSDRTVWAWGYNAHGELGDSTLTTKSTPAQVTGLSEVTTISAGTHSLALHT